jgi:magnesium and cobalt transporter
MPEHSYDVRTDAKTHRSLFERLTALISPEPENRAELLEVLHDAHERNLIDADALSMIEGVFQVSDLSARDIMVPRSQMDVIDISKPIEEWMPQVLATAHSRFPAVEGERDRVVGILLAKDLLRYYAEESFDVRDMLRPAIFIPESKRLNVLLRDFRANHNHMAIVVDEYSGVAGLITIEDVLEQIVGDIEDEYDFDEEEDNILSIKEGQLGPRWRVKALTEIAQFNEEIGTDLPEDDVDTIGGLVANHLGRMPHKGDVFDLGNLRFEVLRADARQVHVLLVEKLPLAEDGAWRRRRNTRRSPDWPTAPAAAVAGFYWLYISMHTYGGMAAPVAACAVLLLGMAMALYTACATGFAAWLRGRWRASDAVLLLAFLPALWALSEWLRGTVFTGFPWSSIGYAHNVSPLAGYAPLVGVYGIGLLAALLSGALALAIGAQFRRNLRRFLMACVVVLGLGVGLNLHGWTEPDGAPMSVRLLQTNVQQEMKFAPEQIENTLAMVEVMIRAGRADLIATPETAIPILANRLPAEYVEGLVRYARTSGSHLMLGIPIADSPTAYANSAVGIAPDRDGSYRFDKHHLVPFGEFVPQGCSTGSCRPDADPVGRFQPAARRRASRRSPWQGQRIAAERLLRRRCSAKKSPASCALQRSRPPSC